MNTLFLYPGAHKTGTSFLQKALEICRETLENNGTLVARRSRFYEVFQPIVRMSTKELKFQRQDALEQARIMFESDDLNKDLVLSIENIFGEFGPKPYGAIERVLNNLQFIFPDHQIQATYYVRRQDTFLESYYVQCIHKGSGAGWDEFWRTHCQANIDWLSIVETLEHKLGPKHVGVRAFEDMKRGRFRFLGEFFKDFAAADSNMLVKRCRGNLGNTNISLSTLGIDIATSGFNFLDERRERERFAKHIQEIYNVQNGDRFKIDERLRHEIAEKYFELNLALCSHVGFEQQIREHYLFSDTLKRNSNERDPIE